MMLERRTTEELVRIAAAGGGFDLNAGPRTTEELIRIAAAARQGSSGLTFRGLSTRTTEELIRIGAAGKGQVFFGD